MKRDHDFEEIVQKYSQLSFVTGIVTLGFVFFFLFNYYYYY